MIVYDKNKRDLVIPNGLGNLNGLADSYLEAAREDGREEIRAYMTELTVTENGRYVNENGWDVVLVNVDADGDTDPDDGSYDEGYDEGYDDGYKMAEKDWKLPFFYNVALEESEAIFLTEIGNEMSIRLEDNNFSTVGLLTDDVYDNVMFKDRPSDSLPVNIPLSIKEIIAFDVKQRDLEQFYVGEGLSWNEFIYMDGFNCQYFQTINENTFDGLSCLILRMDKLGMNFITEQTFVTPDLSADIYTNRRVKNTVIEILENLIDSLYDFSTSNTYGINKSYIRFKGFNGDLQELTERAAAKNWIVVTE